MDKKAIKKHRHNLKRRGRKYKGASSQSRNSLMQDDERMFVKMANDGLIDAAQAIAMRRALRIPNIYNSGR